MNKQSRDVSSKPTALRTTARGAGWPGSLILGLALVVVYLINGRELGTEDTWPTALLPLNILRGDGIYLDNERLGTAELNQPILYCLTISHRHLVSLYPIAPAWSRCRSLHRRLAMDLYRPGLGPKPPGGLR